MPVAISLGSISPFATGRHFSFFSVECQAKTHALKEVCVQANQTSADPLRLGDTLSRRSGCNGQVQAVNDPPAPADMHPRRLKV